jgi:two-component system OmpR family response regulator
MPEPNMITIFLVDDDALYLRTLELEINQNITCLIKTFTTGEQCIGHLHLKPNVVILDYHLNAINKTAINGLETLDRIKAQDSHIPVVMLSSQDKIEIAVNCMQHQAVDYVVKSETAFVRLKKTIAQIFLNQRMEKELNWYMDRL